MKTSSSESASSRTETSTCARRPRARRHLGERAHERRRPAVQEELLELVEREVDLAASASRELGERIRERRPDAGSPPAIAASARSSSPPVQSRWATTSASAQPRVRDDACAERELLPTPLGAVEDGEARGDQVGGDRSRCRAHGRRRGARRARSRRTARAPCTGSPARGHPLTPSPAPADVRRARRRTPRAAVEQLDAARAPEGPFERRASRDRPGAVADRRPPQRRCRTTRRFQSRMP